MYKLYIHIAKLSLIYCTLFPFRILKHITYSYNAKSYQLISKYKITVSTNTTIYHTGISKISLFVLHESCLVSAESCGTESSVLAIMSFDSWPSTITASEFEAISSPRAAASEFEQPWSSSVGF